MARAGKGLLEMRGERNDPLGQDGQLRSRRFAKIGVWMSADRRIFTKTPRWLQIGHCKWKNIV